jgi:hypothetical protein
MGSVGGGFGRATQFDLPDSAEPLTAVTQQGVWHVLHGTCDPEPVGDRRALRPCRGEPAS